MALKQVWIGTVGPFEYDDEQVGVYGPDFPLQKTVAIFGGHLVASTAVEGPGVTSDVDPGHTHSGVGGADIDAIHDNVAAEISAITAKASPTTADYLLIEDAADGDSKKSITIGDLPGVSDHGGLSGLGDDDHTQYLLISGTRAMSGNLDLGSNNIINCPQIGVSGDTDLLQLASGALTVNGTVGIIGALSVAGGISSTGDTRITSTTPRLFLMESDQTDKNWRMQVTGGNFYISQVQDGEAFIAHAIKVSHTTRDVSVVDGNLTIGDGTANPTLIINKGGAGEATINFTSVGDPGWRIYHDTAEGLRIVSDKADEDFTIRVNDGGVERDMFIIDSSEPHLRLVPAVGFVSVGAITPAVQLDVGGDLTVRGGNLSVGVDGTTAGSLELFGNSTTTGGSILLYPGNDDDTNTNAWIIQDMAGGFNISAVGGASGDKSILTIDETDRKVSFNVSISSSSTIDATDEVTAYAGFCQLTDATTGAGMLRLERGVGGGYEPSLINMESSNGTDYFLWFTDAGVLRVATFQPASDTSGGPV